MSAVAEQVHQGPAVEAVRHQKPSLLAKFASKYSVDPRKMLDTLKATAFRQRPNRDGVVIEPSDEQMISLLIVADQYGLNPFTKEIYAFLDPKTGAIVPVVGVDGWIRIINENKAFRGVEFVYAEETDKRGRPEWIEAVIYRTDRDMPVRIREFFDECYRETAPWNQSGRRMLRHKALIQCARVAFGFGGIYDEDEAARIVEGDVRVVATSSADDPLTGLNERVAAKRAAQLAQQQQQTLPQALPKAEATDAVVTTTQTPAATERAAETPDTTAAAASASADATGDSAPAEDARPQQASEQETKTPPKRGTKAAAAPADSPMVSYATLVDRMQAAKTVDELDGHASLINAFPLDQSKELAKRYRELRAALEG